MTFGSAAVEAESGVCGKSKGAACKKAAAAWMSAKVIKQSKRMHRFISLAFIRFVTKVTSASRMREMRRAHISNAYLSAET
ncbi:MAG: hypothetical protein ETSY2_09820 [Candidatus Entotheonella gemina]|uniref:Uncharacterized protein n=1 Tax=Candidatus Entotheonella gemina TaxID=1429439 RepID=W4MCN2_9BACT|nr:MAG: hypothetical protein ETSY2_09820 [Candidatus Entotheonella gemina]